MTQEHQTSSDDNPIQLPTLPLIDGSTFTLLCKDEYWDGVLSGLLRDNQQHLWWFSFIVESDDTPRRLFNLHRIPLPDYANATTWSTDRDTLGYQFLLAANPTIYPVTEQQLQQLGSVDSLNQRSREINAARTKWEHTVDPTFQFWEAPFNAAIHVFQDTPELRLARDRKRAWIEQLRTVVRADDADADAGHDGGSRQGRLDALFAAVPFELHELDMFWHRQPDGHLTRLDWHGQPLPASHYISREQMGHLHPL
eukprot:gnl/Dysnectes_brevis/7009_a11366_262.p1 GENE.gnl/Dysnectes_brevis/7009_a11366_262~~gnl/Dysnectes_brevis/7009_a11366_262.p1  ORF type:complete len:254 (+),score=60.04 gnl/Dysnectes_brevis/7009_a11366_262:110-871(+)